MVTPTIFSFVSIFSIIIIIIIIIIITDL